MSEKQRMAAGEEMDTVVSEDKYYLRSHQEGRVEFYESSCHVNDQIDKFDTLPVFDNGNCFITERRPIILGISPGNSYYFDDRNLLKILKFANTFTDCVKLFIPDAISIHNYRALGALKAESKARLKGNRLRNKIKLLLKSNLALASSDITDIDWVKEVETCDRYKDKLDYVRTLFRSHEQFQREALEVTDTVLQGLQESRKGIVKQNQLQFDVLSEKVTPNVEQEKCCLTKDPRSLNMKESKRNPILQYGEKGKVSCSIAHQDYDVNEGVNYLLKELAFFLSLPDIYDGFGKSTYVYHKPWPVFENLLNGVYDGVVQKHLGFVILK